MPRQDLFSGSSLSHEWTMANGHAGRDGSKPAETQKSICTESMSKGRSGLEKATSLARSDGAELPVAPLLQGCDGPVRHCIRMRPDSLIETRRRPVSTSLSCGFSGMAYIRNALLGLPSCLNTLATKQMFILISLCPGRCPRAKLAAAGPKGRHPCTSRKYESEVCATWFMPTSVSRLTMLD